MPTAEWRKSSFSTGGNSDCVEVAWRKSSFSGGSASSCVEVGLDPARARVRDSKNVSGPTLSFPTAGWLAAVTRLPGGKGRS
jgi:hypothetical protein